MLLNFLVQMATRKYGKVLSGQAIGSLLGARLGVDLYESHRDLIPVKEARGC
jgi:hypothetical protein